MTYTKDTTRLSVLVVAFLLVGSAFAFLPAFAATGATRTNTSNPDCATPCVNNASPPVLVGEPYVIVGTGSTTGDTTFGVNVTNPATNAFSITSLTIVAPSSSEGFVFTGTPTCGTANTLLGSLGAHSSSAVQCTAGTGTGLPPGFSEVIALGTLEGPSILSSASPTIGTFTSIVVDSSGTGESYPGSSFNVYSIAPDVSLSISLSSSSSTFVAGSSALTVTATLGSGEVGVPIVFGFSNSAYPSSGFTSTISPATTLSSGTTTTATWTPSNHAGDATALTVTLGNSAITATTTNTVQTIAGSPSEVSFYFENSGTSYSTDYLTTASTLSGYAAEGSSTIIQVALSDSYANPVTFSSAITSIQLTSSGGDFFYATNSALEASLGCGTGFTGATNFACPTSGHRLGLNSNITSNSDGAVSYVQSSLYGATSSISATITTSSGTYTGTSGTIITSTLDSTLPVPKVFNDTLNAQSPGANGDALVQAGSQVYIVESLTNPVQQGVPITLNFCPACASTSAGYNTALTGFVVSETLYTNSSGMVQEDEPVNLTIGATAQFNATMAAPGTTDTTNVVDSAGLSIPVYTTVGALSTLVVNVGADSPPSTGPNVSYLGVGATGYVDVAYADAYGNLIPIGDAPSTQVQITLAATSGGLLSATNVYISANQVATNSTGSIGSIELTMPSTTGTTVTLSASGVVAGKSVVGTASITAVSDSPSINVTSPLPLNGNLYSHSLETVFMGTANASLGLPSTDIATIGYKVGSAQWYQVSTASEHNVTWSIPVILTEGLNTVMFNATDNESPAVTTVIGPFTVLVDTSAPTFSAPAVINSGATVSFNVTSAEGDLNASSVGAWANGTAIPSSDITVTGTNNLGSSVTYSVSINPPVAGTWSLVVNATTLAGLTGTTSVTVTTTSTTVIPPVNAITFTAPTYYFLGNTYNTVAVPVTNTQSSGSITAVVFAVAHNAAGQTLEVSTATVTVAAGASQTAYVVLNLPSGTYSVNVFVWTTSGASISTAQTVSITYS